MKTFERLVVEQIPRLRRYARALTGDRVPADDLVQETLARAISRRHLWVPRSRIRPWLFTIMHNLFVNDLQKQARTPALFAAEENDARLAAKGHAETDLILRDLDRALAELTEEQREVVLLIGLEQLSYKETARVLGIPPGTVMSRLSRGRERLRDLISGESKAGLRRIK
ncbi:MAG TPA: RNA polymerase sigma factor [Gammaproteobacteria bacterium]|nr:RNA polymerase sigma factor [Gammaproteobacteria bacterium]